MKESLLIGYYQFPCAIFHLYFTNVIRRVLKIILQSSVVCFSAQVQLCFTTTHLQTDERDGRGMSRLVTYSAQQLVSAASDEVNTSITALTLHSSCNVCTYPELLICSRSSLPKTSQQPGLPGVQNKTRTIDTQNKPSCIPGVKKKTKNM